MIKSMVDVMVEEESTLYSFQKLQVYIMMPVCVSVCKPVCLNFNLISPHPLKKNILAKDWFYYKN